MAQLSALGVGMHRGESKGDKVRRCLAVPKWVGGNGVGEGPAGVGSPLGSPEAPAVPGQWKQMAGAQWEHGEGCISLAYPQLLPFGCHGSRELQWAM